MASKGVAAQAARPADAPTKPAAGPEDIVGQLLALPPHVGGFLKAEGSEDALRCVLALTVEAEEARQLLASRERAERSIDREKSADIVEQAIRKRLNKNTGEITRKERESITELNLSVTDLTDLTPLAGLSGLQSLNLTRTQVSNLTPLAGLSGLQSLDLMSTQASDLRPLAGLSGLQRLDLKSTPVSDLTPLAGLSGLQMLYLNGTQVSDLTPLAGLSGLQSLLLWSTQVSDLTPLAGLSGLKELWVDKAVDTGALKGIEALAIRRV